MLILLVVLCVAFSALSSNFLTVTNWSNLLIVQATTGAMALGAIFVLILGEFDVSLGYMISFCMMTGAVLSEKGVSGVGTILIMVATGAVCGLLSGLLTVKVKISSFISTLGVGILLFGLNLAISNGEVHSSNIPAIMTAIGQKKLLGIGLCFWILLLFCAVIYILLNHTTFGRNLYAVGGSEKIAFLAGIKTDRIRILAFVLSGAFTGLASVFQLGQAVGVGLHLGLGGLGFLQLGRILFRLAHQHAHLLGQLVALGAEFAGLGDGGAVFRVQGDYLVHQRELEILKFLFNVFLDHIRVFADKSHIQHDCYTSTNVF